MLSFFLLLFLILLHLHSALIKVCVYPEVQFTDLQLTRFRVIKEQGGKNPNKSSTRRRLKKIRKMNPVQWFDLALRLVSVSSRLSSSDICTFKQLEANVSACTFAAPPTGFLWT